MRIVLLIGMVALAVACGGEPAATPATPPPAGATDTCIYAPEGTYTITIGGDSAAASAFCRSTDASLIVKQAAAQTVCTLNSSDGKLTLDVNTAEANRVDAQGACDRLKGLYPG